MNTLNEQTRVKATNWLEEIRYLPPLMESDYVYLKDHLIEEVNSLKQSQGLKEEDALDIAMFRIGDRGLLKRIYNETNASLLQMQRIILPAAGVVFFFICFYLMQFIGQLFFGFNLVFQHQYGNMIPIYTFLASYHLLFIFLTIYIFRNGLDILSHFDWVLRPVHILGLFIVMFTLSSGNFLLTRTIDLSLEILKVSNPLYSLWGFSEYSFPLVFIACFFLLYLRYNRLLDLKYAFIENDLYLRKKTGTKDSIIPVREEQAMKYWNDGMEYLYEHTRFTENEALILEMRKQGYELTSWNFSHWKKGDYFMKAFLKMLSGILFYFLIYYLLSSAARFFICLLQALSSSPMQTIKHTWTLVISGYLFILFFTSSIFFLDEQLMHRLRNLRINSHNLLKSLILVIFLGSMERLGTHLSYRAMASVGLDVYSHMEEIFEFLHYTFPLLVCTIFLILSLRYNWDQIKLKAMFLLKKINN